ncbi:MULTISPECIES: hypothetical protein [Paenibacillus]|jgi:hypothetical protein|uniref:Uncharacterized protein n=2 Tax=Paenibacillus TaxID=44249 RepID=A0AAJ3J1M3_PAEPO|nr:MULTISPECIES: hypothetical protein [Paenibacillus]AHC19051.1 hypothetical protein X809_07365 [Paenibacillus polymyxa CR1]ALA41259.1 hypothetical protein ABE82_06875 [Paenibacillus peoriae]APB76961.1 hypothetical protein PPYC2_19210 [Paenibacillus polymyxa]MBP1175273.1 hypothetical protein [Paenibacillus sp. PvR133]MDH2330088.1 hypothetical protein [Paenibacillus polymyxa]
MLALSDPAWTLLQGPYGSSQYVPEMLKQLQAGYDGEMADTLYWEELYHQNTLYTCTFAAVPYLVDIALKSSDIGIRADIYNICGIFEAKNNNPLHTKVPLEFTRDQVKVDSSLAEYIYAQYRSAIVRLAELTEEMVLYAKEHEGDIGKRYVLAAGAAFQGYRCVAYMLQSFDTGDEYTLDCPHCGTPLYIWPDEQNDTLVVYDKDPVNSDNLVPHPISPRSLDRRGANMQWLHEYAQKIEENKLLAQLPYLNGWVDCPVCNTPIYIWDELMKMADGVRRYTA